MKGKRIIITGGGTAGHIYPAVSVIEYIKDNYPGTSVLFIGTGKGMEKDLIAELGIEFRTVGASGLSASKNFFKKILVYLKFLFLLISGSIRSLSIIRGFKPDFVLGTGGYVCGPVFLGAKLLGIKIYIHEQNSIPGRLNRLFARYAEVVFVSFDGSQRFFNIRGRKKVPGLVFSGNPVRKEIRNFSDCPPDYKRFGLEKGRFTIVAFGGSLGAEKINNSVSGLYEYYRKSRDLQFILISGKRFYPEFRDKMEGLFQPADMLIFRVFPYINDIAAIYRIADLIISRSGATTIAELAVTGIPSILIPYPEAIGNHQFYNARNLVEAGKSVLITDNDLNAGILKDAIDSLLANNTKKYVNMREMTLNIEQPESEAIIVGKILGRI